MFTSALSRFHWTDKHASQEEIAALNPAASPYAKMTPTGVDPKLAAQRARVDWDAATEFTAGEEPKDLSDMVPPAVVGSSPMLICNMLVDIWCLSQKTRV